MKRRQIDKVKFTIELLKDFCHTSTKLPGLQRSGHKVDVRCALRVICGANGLEHEEHRQQAPQQAYPVPDTLR